MVTSSYSTTTTATGILSSPIPVCARSTSDSRVKRAIDPAPLSGPPIVRFKLVKPMSSSLESSSSATTSSPPVKQHHTRQKSHPFANLTFTALHAPEPSSNGDTGLRHAGSSGSLSTPLTPTHATTASYPNDAGISASANHRRARARSTTHLPSAAKQHNLTDHAHAIPIPGSVSTRTSSSKARRGAGSASAPSSPRSTSPVHRREHTHTHPQEWYFTPSATPVVLPTPSTSPRPRKRSLGATRSVPSSPGRVSPVNSYFSSKQTQLERTPSVAEALQRTAGASSSSIRHGLTRASASTSAMSASYPRQGVDSFALGPQQRSSSTFDVGPLRHYSSEDDSDDHAMVMVGGKGSRSAKRLDHTSRSRNQSFASLKKRSSAADVTHEYNRGSGPSLRGRIPAAPAMTMETETDGEFLRPLPTSRITASQQQQHASPVIFRWLAIIPPTFAALFHLIRLFKPATGGSPINRADHFVCVLWTLVVSYQSLSFTTGLLHRWRFYYPIFSVIIRLLALQAGICWPLMQLTMRVLDHDTRPLLCWTVIGTTTCVSKAVQMWATSNLRGGIDDDKKTDGRRTRPGSPTIGENALLLDGGVFNLNGPHHQPASWRDRGFDVLQSAADLLVPGGTADVIPPRTPQQPETDLDQTRMTTTTRMRIRRKRRWDWTKVYRKCVLPASVVYVVMAWSMLLDRELTKGSPC
ncbi:hypothetical protein FRB96_009573 [Tulasnella sp. 330]|nr:hypothetical protein FRB96_009573 [Tulasnella sp. 330]KAG8872484.1 hypothetical protein FRB97_007581 [Tulasnella sp. 331]KAG8883904.1 hypothetical protein FRB98_002756 [Tulasnella sp. 332]